MTCQVYTGSDLNTLSRTASGICPWGINQSNMSYVTNQQYEKTFKEEIDWNNETASVISLCPSDADSSMSYQIPRRNFAVQITNVEPTLATDNTLVDNVREQQRRLRKEIFYARHHLYEERMGVDSHDGSQSSDSMPFLVQRWGTNDDSSTDEENEVQYEAEVTEYYDTDETEATSVLTDEDEMFDDTFDDLEKLVDLTLYDSDEEVVDLTEDLEEENNEVILMAIDKKIK